MRPRARTGPSAPIPPWSARTSTPPGPGTSCPPSWSRGASPNDKNLPARAVREALGRSRGGLSTKIHLAADRRGRAVTGILTPGQHGDCPQFIPLLDQVRIARRGKGRPRTRPGRAMADKAYSSAANRAYLANAGSRRSSRSRRTRRSTAVTAAARAAERCFSKLKQFRAVATRYVDRTREPHEGPACQDLHVTGSGFAAGV
jgi:transposase